MARKLTVEIVGDTSNLQKSLSDAGKSSGKMGGLMKGAGLAVGAGIGVAAVAVKSFISAAQASEVSQAKMTTQLKALGIGYRAHAKEIDNVIQKTSQLSGLDDEDLQDSFTNIVRVTGDVNQALKLNALAADIARAKHIPLEAASKSVAKAATGNASAFSRLGVVMQKGATGQEAIAAAQRKFAGQAEAYGKTAAGAQERFGVAIENLQEKLGEKLLPVFTKVATAVSGFVEDFTNGTGTAGKFRDVIVDVFTTIRDVVQATIGAVRQTLADHREEIRQVGEAVSSIFHKVVIPAFEFLESVARRVLPGIEAMAKGFVQTIRGIAEVITGILTLDFGKAWDGIKDIFGGAIKALAGLLRAGTAGMREAAARLFGGIAESVTEVVTTITDAIAAMPRKILGLVDNVASAGRHIATAILDGIADGLKATGKFIVDIASAIAKAVKGAVNAVIDSVNNALEFTIKGPGPIPDIHLNPPDIPHLATGGYIQQSGIAVVHQGEHVIPRGMMSAGGGIVNITVNGYVGNDQDIAERVATELNRMSAARGQIFRAGIAG